MPRLMRCQDDVDADRVPAPAFDIHLFAFYPACPVTGRDDPALQVFCQARLYLDPTREHLVDRAMFGDRK